MQKLKVIISLLSYFQTTAIHLINPLTMLSDDPEYVSVTQANITIPRKTASKISNLNGTKHRDILELYKMRKQLIDLIDLTKKRRVLDRRKQLISALSQSNETYPGVEFLVLKDRHDLGMHYDSRANILNTVGKYAVLSANAIEPNKPLMYAFLLPIACMTWIALGFGCMIVLPYDTEQNSTVERAI